MAISKRSLSTSTDASVTNLFISELLPALQRLDRLIEHAVTAAQITYGPEAATDPYRGLYISQKEVERLLTRQPEASRLWSELTTAEGSAPIPAGDGSRLAWLRQVFDLSPFEADVLLVALAPELDLRYERLYAYLQN